MKIGSVLENQKIEKRISITPDIVKKYTSLGFEIFLSENYGHHIGIKDDEYEKLGVKFSKDDKEILGSSDIIVQLGILPDDKISIIKESQIFIGVLNPYENKDKLEILAKKKINLFSLELLPRITRAQSMDILSSQANLAGYKAVIESFANFEKAIPMMMTAAGTIPAAKVLVVGSGVAGLQAIATAKRMGAIVFATDVRMASKEQVEIKISKIKLCHIDVNTYGDTKKIFNHIKNKVIKGGIIIFDDFGIWGVDGIKKFIYEIELRYSKNFHFIKNYMGQCILIKK